MTTADTHTSTVTISFDGEPLHHVPRHTTPDAILTLGNVDPATHYLVRVKHHEQESFAGRGGEPIIVHEGEVFVSVSTGPTPTS